MFLHVTAETSDAEIGRALTTCRECDALVTMRVLQRTRVVTVFWVLKSTEQRFFLHCSACEAEFKLKARKRAELEHVDIDTLQRQAGGRYVPSSVMFMVFLATITLPVPVLNLLLVWFAWTNRKSFGAGLLRYLRALLWIAAAVTAAFVVALLVEGR